jgi:ergothioneine biosynthesis protein EgtB
MKLVDTSTPSGLARRFRDIRAASLALAKPLSEADAQVQSMPEASPTKWHLAHTTWFFETLILEAAEVGFRPHHPAFRVLFNSYYNGIGEQHARPQRGLITRPGLAEVLAYRRSVDERVLALLARGPDPACLAMLTLGLHHEQQHQELILCDLLHLLSCNPLQPAYFPGEPSAPSTAIALDWVAYEGGLVDIGHQGPGFAFDNEQPRHREWLAPYALANRLVTQGEWAEFVADGAYREPRWWLAAGWDWVRAQGIEAPQYWRRVGCGDWQVFTLRGPLPLDAQSPVAHVSLYEADAYARWLGAQIAQDLRLPTEAEWEHAVAPDAAQHIDTGNFVDSAALQPLALPRAKPGLMQAMGDVWQWTTSAYAPYPGFRPWAGAVAEYNGKFMANQYVLRGVSCATPRSHIRASYRNFFPADARWQFNGVRLARGL